MSESQSIFEMLLLAPVFILAFAFVLSIVVFFHELGHFMAARVSGVKVDVFSIGFGKTVLSWRDKHGTEWRLSRWPLGGYVKFFGDAGPASQPAEDVRDAQEEEDPDAKPFTTQFPTVKEAQAATVGLSDEEKKVCFHFKPVVVRAFIVAAGPMANFVLSLVIFTALLMTYGEVISPARVGQVIEGGAAEEAGLLPGDEIKRINGRKMRSFSDLQNMVIFNSGEELTLEIERDGEDLTLTAVPRRTETTDAFGNTIEAGMLGVSSADLEIARYGFFSAVGRSGERIVQFVGSIFKYLKRVVTGEEDASQLGGPVRIAQYAGQAATQGFQSGDGVWQGIGVSLITLVNLSAALSVSVGLINLFPIPMLDGGHLMYYAYEAAAGRPLSERAQGVGFRIGFVAIISMLIFVTWNDLQNLRVFEFISGLFS